MASTVMGEAAANEAKEEGMPAAIVAPAAIGAAGQLGGALLGSRSAGKAADQQMRANREALAWEKQRYGAALNPYNRDRQLWEQGRNALLSRYGISIPGYGTYSPVQMPGTPQVLRSQQAQQATQQQVSPGTMDWLRRETGMPADGSLGAMLRRG
jgi:hypothetical protein